MRQYIVAYRLALTQTATVTNHQPDVRAQHREMIANIFGIGRADADVDQCNALTVVSDQVPGRHLVFFPCQIGNRLFRCLRVGGDPNPARTGEGNVRAIRIEDLATAPTDEFIDVTRVVGKQDIRLEVFNRRAGVVLQACQ